MANDITLAEIGIKCTTAGSLGPPAVSMHGPYEVGGAGKLVPQTEQKLAQMTLLVPQVAHTF